MPGGIHYLLGCLLVWLLRFFNTTDGKSSSTSTTTTSSATTTQQQQHQQIRRLSLPPLPVSNKWLKVGLVFGSVLPDIDVLVTVFLIIFSYFRGGTTDDFVEIAELVHRSYTHTLVFWVPSLLLLWLYSFLISFSQKTTATTKHVVKFMIGICIGSIVHTLSDTIYLKGVKMMWPISNEVFFYEIPQLHLYHIYYYTTYTQKMFFVLDHCSEILFYCILMMCCEMDNTKLFRLKILCYLQFSANGLCFLIDRITDMAFHNFVILLYFPGVTFLAISVLVPLFMASEIHSLDFSRSKSKLSPPSPTSTSPSKCIKTD